MLRLQFLECVIQRAVQTQCISGAVLRVDDLNVTFSDTEKSVNSPRSTGNAFNASRAACVNACVVAALSAIDFSDGLVEGVEECRSVSRGEHERWSDLDDVVEHTGVARQKTFVFKSIAELDCSARIRSFAPHGP